MILEPQMQNVMKIANHLFLTSSEALGGHTAAAIHESAAPCSLRAYMYLLQQQTQAFSAVMSRVPTPRVHQNHRATPPLFFSSHHHQCILLLAVWLPRYAAPSVAAEHARHG